MKIISISRFEIPFRSALFSKKITVTMNDDNEPHALIQLLLAALLVAGFVAVTMGFCH